MADAQRRLAAIVAIDVAGYSRLMGRDEQGTLTRLKEHRAAIDPIGREHGGRIVGTAGDGVLVEFPSIVEAVRFALRAQAVLAERNADVPADDQMLMRMGINLGDVLVDGNDIYGDGVNIAARLEALAEPGGMCLSGAAYEQVRDRVNAEWQDGGEHEVKNIARRVRIWRWSPNTTPASGSPATPKGPIGPKSAKPSIAVLPFANMSGDADQEFFADGMTEDITTELSKFRWFLVIARNSTFTYKGKAVPVTTIGSELNARYVVQGSVRKAGNRVRVSGQLIDTSNGAHIWAERYDRDLIDIFHIQDQITHEIKTAIVPEVARMERQRAALLPADRLGAWEHYQRAQWHLYRFTKDDNRKAEELLKAAIGIDPSFSMACAALSIKHFTDVLSAYAIDPADSVASALAFAERAVALDPDDPSAHLALGRAYSLKKDTPKAEAALKRTLELSPSHAHAYHGLSFIYGMQHRFEEVIWAVDQAIAQSPKDPILWAYENMRSFALHSIGQYEEALAWAEKASQAPGSGFWPHLNAAVALVYLGRKDEAAASIAKARAANPQISIARVFQMQVERTPRSMLEGLRLAGLPA